MHEELKNSARNLRNFGSLPCFCSGKVAFLSAWSISSRLSCRGWERIFFVIPYMRQNDPSQCDSLKQMGLPVAKVGSVNTARRQRMALGSKHALFLFVFLKTARMVQHLGREGSGDGNIQCRSEAEAEAKKRFYDGGTMRQSQFRTRLLMSTAAAIARGRYLCNFCSPPLMVDAGIRRPPKLTTYLCQIF